MSGQGRRGRRLKRKQEESADQEELLIDGESKWIWNRARRRRVWNHSGHQSAEIKRSMIQAQRNEVIGDANLQEDELANANLQDELANANLQDELANANLQDELANANLDDEDPLANLEIELMKQQIDEAVAASVVNSPVGAFGGWGILDSVEVTTEDLAEFDIQVYADYVEQLDSLKIDHGLLLLQNKATVEELEANKAKLHATETELQAAQSRIIDVENEAVRQKNLMKEKVSTFIGKQRKQLEKMNQELDDFEEKMKA